MKDTQEEPAEASYVPATENPREFSAVAIITGVILAAVFGAANAYLGLRVGMTVSASIPAAVVSMMILRVLLRRSSILENNLVQTIASAGESVAAGVIFTVPVFFLWADEGTAEPQPLSTVTLLALCGGLLGTLFMIPLRRYLIIKEEKTLTFPEGRACAQVLLAGEGGKNSGSGCIFWGAGAGILVKFLLDGFRTAANRLTLAFPSLRTEVGMEPYPALLAVGYICGPRVAATICAGGVLSWLVLIPAIIHFGYNAAGADGVTIGELYAQGGAQAIWSHHIRYIGAGAVATGGIIGLLKALPAISSSFLGLFRSFTRGGKAPERTDRDLDLRALVGLVVLITAVLAFTPQIPLNGLGIVLFIFCGFFFAVVAARIAGMLGSSNSPTSGMTIAALLVSAFVLKNAGVTGVTGMVTAMTVAVLCCLVTSTAGDIAQDLKTGRILGGTPWKMQIGEMIGTLSAAVCIGGVLLLLHRAWGFGSGQLPAPQAHLMKMVIEGVMQDTMAWPLVLIGGGIALMAELLGVSPLAVAIGVFLPLSTTSGVFLGGLARGAVNRLRLPSPERGTLLASGMIAGEGLAGIALAALAVTKWDDKMDCGVSAGMPGGAAMAAALFLALVLVCRRRKA